MLALHQYRQSIYKQHTLEPQRVKQTPTSQPVTLISPEMCFSFKRPSVDCCRVPREKKETEREKEGRGVGRGLIYLNNLVVMKAARVCWRWMDGVSGEKSGEGRVNGVKSNCRQIVGLDNGLNGPYKPLNPPGLVCVCIHAYVHIVPKLPYYSHEFHMQPICVAI